VATPTLAAAGLRGPEGSPSRPRGQRTRQRRPQLKLPRSFICASSALTNRIGQHPDEALRASLGILFLANEFSGSALEHACQRARELRAFGYEAARSLITAPATVATEPASIPARDTVRGSEQQAASIVHAWRRRARGPRAIPEGLVG